MVGSRWNLQEFEEGFYWSFYESCDQDTQEVLDRRLVQLLKKGNLSKRPISAPLRDKILELRAGQARVLFCFRPERTIVILHAIIKKTGSVPNREIELAISRRKALEKEQEEDTNAVVH